MAWYHVNAGACKRCVFVLGPNMLDTVHVPGQRSTMWLAIREQMFVCGCRYSPVCMGILYHVSMDDKHNSLFQYTGAVRLLYKRLSSVEDLRREPELIALAVNLTQNARCAAALCEGGNFDKLMRKAVQGWDDLLFKVMRNCSQARALPADCTVLK
jgi:Kinesin-associated protein (KAP)